MDIVRFNEGHYQRKARDLGHALRRIEAAEGLPRALATLERLHVDLGFITGDAAQIPRRVLVDPGNPRRHLVAQVNLARAGRPGAASAEPRSRPGVPCALCPRDLMRLHRYREFGYDLALAGPDRWRVYPNPFPAFPRHGVVVTEEHLSQEGVGSTPRATADALRAIAVPMLDLARRAPGFVVTFNSLGAGATQWHRHLQLFERPQGRRFPLEAATLGLTPSARGTPVGDEHPVRALWFSGGVPEVLAHALEWVQGWHEAWARPDRPLAANLIATDDGAAGVQLYVVPRTRGAAPVGPLSGVPGCVEVLGELVLQTDAERELVDSGRLDHAAAWSLLSRIETPGLD